MRIVYDDDAILFANDIATFLQLFGYGNDSESIGNFLEQLEGELPHFPSIATQLVKDGELDRAIRLFFFDHKSNTSLSPDGASLLSALSSTRKVDRRRVEQAVTRAADVLDQQDFNCDTPLNVVAGLSVMFDLIVIPRRNYRQADERFQKILGKQLHIVDDGGNTIYGPKEHSVEALVEDRFWELFDVVRNEFSFDQLEQPSPAESTRTPNVISPQTMIEQQSRSIAAILLNEISQDRAMR